MTHQFWRALWEAFAMFLLFAMWGVFFVFAAAMGT
jgi:hypothetical protein